MNGNESCDCRGAVERPGCTHGAGPVTDADRTKAADVLSDLVGLTPLGATLRDLYGNVIGSDWSPKQIEPIAAAIAAERAAVTRPLLALAEELEGWRANAERYADAHAGSIACDRALGRVRAYERAITRIRAVAAALGETGGGK